MPSSFPIAAADEVEVAIARAALQPLVMPQRVMPSVDSCHDSWTGEVSRTLLEMIHSQV